MKAQKRSQFQPPSAWKIKGSVSTAKPSMTQAKPIKGNVSDPKSGKVSIKNAVSCSDY